MKVWKPGIATYFLRKYDQSQDVPHRVTVYFAGIGPGTLRADMEAHAAGRGMSQRFCQQIRAYQLCMLDDTVAEVVPRDVSFQAHRAPSSSMYWRASSVRLAQNLNLEASQLGRHVTHKTWPNWLVRPCITSRATPAPG